MKRNLLREVDAQNKRTCEIENKRKQRDALVSEINTKSKEIATTKKAKKHLKEISKKVHCDVPLFVKKNEKLNEERLFYNQSIKDAQNEIKLKNDKLQEIDQRNVTEKSRFFKIHQNDEGMRYNFGKRKYKYTNKDSLCKKK